MTSWLNRSQRLLCILTSKGECVPMVEYDSKYEQSYKEFRPNSNYIISDARIINYKELLETIHILIQKSFMHE